MNVMLKNKTDPMGDMTNFLSPVLLRSKDDAYGRIYYHNKNYQFMIGTNTDPWYTLLATGC